MIAISAGAQIKGAVIDAETGDSISFVTVKYKALRLSAISDAFGRYSIVRHEGQTLSFSAVGYKTQTVKVSTATPGVLDVKLKPDSKTLDEVVIKTKRKKYSRKENPAVELMRRVIAAKKQTKLENRDYYQYRNYEKITLSTNDLSQASLDSGFYANKEWYKDHVEVNEKTGKLTLPLIVTERITRKLYRKNPQKERIFVDAEKEYGVTDLFQTGSVYTEMLKEVFTEVDIYDDQVRLLQYPFTSPIGKDAIGFYRYYILDTLKVDNDSCYHLQFLPNNQQDFGFRGELYILKDSTLHVKEVKLSIPSRSDVNFVKNMEIDQKYLRLESGDWVLTDNDMLAELAIVGNKGKFVVTRQSRRNDYAFEAIDDKLFRGRALEKTDPYARMRDDDFWTDNRETTLTKGEAGMDKFIKGIKSQKGFGIAMIGVKAIMENFVETCKSGNDSKVDIGPINSMVSKNDIDGFRLRLSAQTTAALNPHMFLKGYVARGFDSKTNYYGAKFTYSFKKCAYGPDEYPKRNIIAESYYDIASPSDKFMMVDKDNVFASLKWTDVEKMARYKRQAVRFEREEDWGLAISGGVQFEENTATGDWNFTADGALPTDGKYASYRTSELVLELRYTPGQSYINTKQHRFPTNLDSPTFTLKHTVGLKGFMGGDYAYNVTEVGIYKRLWLNSWGKMNMYLKGGIQWSQVPFPLLIAPAANLSYLYQPETFFLVNNMEFLNDKYVSFMYSWDINGKLFNRIPLLKKLQWREIIGFNILYGGLSDKNVPELATGSGSSRLMAFPNGSYKMDPHQPYMEIHVGVHNIFKLFQVEYVRRLTYLDLPTAKKHSVRFGIELTF